MTAVVAVLIAAALFGLGAGFAAINLGANFLDFPDFTPAFAAMIATTP